MDERMRNAREQARKADGKFGEQTHDKAAGIDLAGVAENSPGQKPYCEEHRQWRDEALHRHGLNVEDVPGLADAWDEHFAELDEPEPLTRGSFAQHALEDVSFGRLRGGPMLDTAKEAFDGSHWVPGDYGLADDDPVILVHTRNGGGNRECWEVDPDDDCGCSGCSMDQMAAHELHVADWDDSFDSTYADIVFRVPEGTEDQARRLLEDPDQDDVELSRRQGVLAREAEEIRRGEAAPWSIMGDRGELKELRRAAGSYPVPDWWREKAEHAVAANSQVLDAIDGKATVPDDQTFEVEQFGRRARIARSSVAEKISTYRSAVTREASASRAMAEAQALPDGDLKKWLLADRPEQSYRATEGRGRKMRVTTRSYTPKAPLVKECEEAQSDLERSRKEVDRLRFELTPVRDEYAGQLWAHGWPEGARKPLPPRPQEPPAS